MTAEPEANPLHSRTIGCLFLDDQDATVAVDHVFLREGHAGPCHDCGQPAHDPGQVGLSITDEYEGADRYITVLLTARDALEVANRLTRAASLVLESQEDNADLEREAARFAQATGE